MNELLSSIHNEDKEKVRELIWTLSYLGILKVK